MVPVMSDNEPRKRDESQDINTWMTGKGNPYLLGVGAVIVIGFILMAFGL